MSQNLIASSRNTVVVGLGATGWSCARYLQRRGESFALVDSRRQPPGLEDFRREFPAVPLFLGEVPDSVLATAGELVVSPGLALDDPLLQPARDAGVTLLGDVDLFMREAQAPVVGITGSNGKSTVTALLGAMAAGAGKRVAVGGNLGPAALDLLADEVELYVLELSSFQLERAGELGLAVATVLNLSPDHLDRHGSMPRYHQVKHRIFHGCGSAVANLDDALTRPLVPPAVRVLSYRLGEPELGAYGLREIDGQTMLVVGFEPLMPASEVAIPGRHNLANALAALALGEACGLQRSAMLEALRSFSGLPHRCQRVAERDGVRFINDSKATNTGATQAALAGLGEDNNIVLLAGGQSKGADLSVLLPTLLRYCRKVIVMGEAAPALLSLLDGKLPCERADSMADAVQRAARAANRPGDLVLLSPACASFDMFDSFSDRGDQFAAAVADLPGVVL